MMLGTISDYTFQIFFLPYYLSATIIISSNDHLINNEEAANNGSTPVRGWAPQNFLRYRLLLNKDEFCL